MTTGSASLEIPNLVDTIYPEPNEDHRARAVQRQDSLTKPRGSLGVLETTAIQMAAWQGTVAPRSRPAEALVFAADHPVTKHNVSIYPSEVTAAMVTNFLRGGAAASVLTRSLSVPLTVVDVGVDAPYEAPTDPTQSKLIQTPQSGEVGDLRYKDAMSGAVFEASIRAGQTAVDALPPETQLLILGEMGIGNTTPAAALTGALLSRTPPEWAVGPGTGASGAVLENKRTVVKEALNRVGSVSPAEALRRLGGRDIAALVGAGSRAAHRGMLVLVDGFIVTAAMLAMVRLRPNTRPALLFGHCSKEPAHRALLDELKAQPLLDLCLRLGEGSGALLSLPLVDAACCLHQQMATFDEASVPDRDDQLARGASL